MKTPIQLLICVIVLQLCSLLTSAQVIKLSSFPEAVGTIFLDFDGHYVEGTSWNANGSFYAAPAGLNNTKIEEIFNRVAEDYRPFTINITTDSTVFFKAPVKQRMRVIITTTNEWYGTTGGVALTKSYSWGDDTPCFVFSKLLGFGAKPIAEACSHEAGHTLGLYHQSTYDLNCKKAEEYNTGKGQGEISWAPIMGNSYSRNITTWTKGPSSLGCENMQDDIKIITSANNKINFREDDHGNSMQQATILWQRSEGFSASGILSSYVDVDMFQISLENSSNINLFAVPYNVANDSAGANLDIRLSLLNASGDTIDTYNPQDKVSAVIDTFLLAGEYYLAVQGVGNTFLSDSSSIGFYTIAGSQSVLKTLAIHEVTLYGNNNKGKHQLNWKIVADDLNYTASLQVAKDGIHFEDLETVEGKLSYAYAAPYEALLHYRLKLQENNTKQMHYSNIITLEGSAAPAPVYVQQLSNGKYTVKTRTNAQYTLVDPTGKVMQTGVIATGQVMLQLQSTGIYFLSVKDGGNNFTQKLIKL